MMGGKLYRRQFLIQSAAVSGYLAAMACVPRGGRRLQGAHAVADEPASPRVAALEHELGRGNASALEEFWQRVKAEGAPLIEPIVGDDDHSLVTFVWRGDGATAPVFLTGPVWWTDDLSEVQLLRLRGTDLLYRTYRYRNDFRATYGFVADISPPSMHWDYTDEARSKWQAFEDAQQPDSLNLRHHLATIGGDRSVLELRAALPQPWVEHRQGVARGELHTHRFRSALLGNERELRVYTPPGYPESRPHALLVSFNGQPSLNLRRTDIILDNLLAEGLIPSTVAVFIDNLGWDTMVRELPCYEPFADALATELLPWVRERYHVTAEPSRTVVDGQSAGGLGAAFVAFRQPELFGKVLSQSGFYDWGPGYDRGRGWEEQTFEGNWLEKQYAESSRLPIRFHLDVGLHESYGAWSSNELDSNRRMRDVLEARGYAIHYVEYNGGHEFIGWRGTFADGLVALVGPESQ